MVAAANLEMCLKGTENLLQVLVSLGHRASAKKSQICKQVMYLGYVLEGGQRWLSDACKETVLKRPTPASAKQVTEFLSTARFCHFRIPGFAELAKPLYEATKGELDFIWTEDKQKAFDTLKHRLLEVPALGLWDMTKPFYLFVDEHKRIAKGMLRQTDPRAMEKAGSLSI